eukprot:g1052.t1
MVFVTYFVQKKNRDKSDVSVYDLKIGNDGAGEDDRDYLTFETLRDTFPLRGNLHFRAKVEKNKVSGRSSDKNDFVWIDLKRRDMCVPRYRGCVCLKVLDLGDGLSKNVDAPVFKWNPQDHRNVMDEVKRKAKKKFSAIGKSFAGFLSGAVSRLSGKKMPSTSALHQLRRLRSKMVLPPTASLLSLLQRLWCVVHPEKAFERKSKKWTEIGFQSSDPTTDLRAGGELSLRCLVFLAEAHPKELLRYASEQSGGGKHRYPVCITGVNIVIMLADVFGLSGADDVEARPEIYWDVFEDPKAFFEIFRLSFVLLDRTWKRSNATLPAFQEVLERTKLRLQEVLEMGPTSLLELARAIL